METNHQVSSEADQEVGRKKRNTALINDPNSSGRDFVEGYQQRTTKVDLTVRRFDIFAWFGFNISGWRWQAISALDFKPGDTVVDIGCGPGQNFLLLQQAVASSGKIIDDGESDAMLEHAGQKIAANQWANVQLVCADASQYEFPSRVDAVVSAYTLILVPDCDRVVSKGRAAFVPGVHLVVLHMSWPGYCPHWWRHVLFFFRSYRVTADVIRRRSWEIVPRSMKNRFQDFYQRHF